MIRRLKYPHPAKEKLRRGEKILLVSAKNFRVIFFEISLKLLYFGAKRSRARERASNIMPISLSRQKNKPKLFK
jgi:hypothetical protein